MCRWCVEKPECSCKVECEIALTSVRIAGDVQIICPKCNHSVVQEHFID